MPPGEKKARVPLRYLATSVIPGVFQVARGAAALEGTLLVQTELGTAAWLQALVYI